MCDCLFGSFDRERQIFIVLWERGTDSLTKVLQIVIQIVLIDELCLQLDVERFDFVDLFVGQFETILQIVALEYDITQIVLCKVLSLLAVIRYENLSLAIFFIEIDAAFDVNLPFFESLESTLHFLL